MIELKVRQWFDPEAIIYKSEDTSIRISSRVLHDVVAIRDFGVAAER
jgi:hypothetical protein